MKRDYSDELSPEVRIKMKKNLVYIAIFSIVMIFAGFTSAYIVSMGDTFWVKYPLPFGFWISTGLIICSSATYYFAIRNADRLNNQKATSFMVLTLLLGLGFAYFQWFGYSQLVKEGAHFRSSIMVVDGRYGDYYEIKYNDQFIEVNANDFLVNGKKLNENQMKDLQSFVRPFENIANQKEYKIYRLPSAFTLYFQNEPVHLQGGQLTTESGKSLQYVDLKRLQNFSWNIRDKRGDFFHKGTLGKDFHVYYKGKELQYKNRELMYGNKKLAAPLQLKANQSRDTSTSYLYIITILHLLHILGALIYLIKMVFKSIQQKSYITINEEDKKEKTKLEYEKYTLSLRLGSIFWHFLGILWIYLLIFLMFIH
jgi:cytochrome c oxidase subunit 3